MKNSAADPTMIFYNIFSAVFLYDCKYIKEKQEGRNLRDGLSTSIPKVQFSFMPNFLLLYKNLEAI